MLKNIFPALFSTIATPKAEELIATPYRHDGKKAAGVFFLNGMKNAITKLGKTVHPAFPMTIYYAFKQSEASEESVVSSGWETFLEAIIQSGLTITGTWPMRTEMSSRLVSIGHNALASSIVLVCAKQKSDAKVITKREFTKLLRFELPIALSNFRKTNIAPVDLAQAAIGPGMAIYTRYKNVIDAEGRVLTVHMALAMINQVLDEVLTEQEGDFDADTRWALAWFEQYAFEWADFGMAEQLSKAKNTAVNALIEADIIEAKGGKVRLLKPSELDPNWDPLLDKRLTVWETVHHLSQALSKGGYDATVSLVKKLGNTVETARELCYRLYLICERKKLPQEALGYNALVQSWPEIMAETKKMSHKQQESLNHI